MMSAGAGVGLDDELQDSLFRLGLGAARISVWNVQERRRAVHQRRPRSSATNLPASTGGAVSHCLEVLCKMDRCLGFVGWFECITLFDTYCVSAPAPISHESVPQIGAAIANLVVKVMSK